jgi:hypothetical protein
MFTVIIFILLIILVILLSFNILILSYFNNITNIRGGSKKCKVANCDCEEFVPSENDDSLCRNCDHLESLHVYTQPTTIDTQLTTIDIQPTTIDIQPTTIDTQLTTMTTQPIAMGTAMGTQSSVNYDFSDDLCFSRIAELIYSIIIDRQPIDKDLELFTYCIKYKHVNILLRNMQLLFGIPVDYSILLVKQQITTQPNQNLSAVKVFQESCWTVSFDVLIAEYDKFKDIRPISERKSYFLYWLNVINLSTILVKFKYDITMAKYRDYENCSELYNQLLGNLLAALSCKYDDIYRLYIYHILTMYIVQIQILDL